MCASVVHQLALDVESIRIDYEVWNSTSYASAVMSSEEDALGKSLSGSKAGDQTLYYNRNLRAGSAPFASEAFVRVGQTVMLIVWARPNSFIATSSLAKVAAKAANRLKDALAGKVHSSPTPAPDRVLLAPPGPDLTLLGTTTLPVDVVGQLLYSPAPGVITNYFRGVGVNDVVYGDYALDSDTRMEVVTIGFSFKTTTGAEDWLGEFYATNSNFSNGVYFNYEADSGQYVVAFGKGTRGILLVCRSSETGEQAGRSCEAPLIRVVNGWHMALAAA